MIFVLGKVFYFTEDFFIAKKNHRLLKSEKEMQR